MRLSCVPGQLNELLAWASVFFLAPPDVTVQTKVGNQGRVEQVKTGQENNQEMQNVRNFVGPKTSVL